MGRFLIAILGLITCSAAAQKQFVSRTLQGGDQALVMQKLKKASFYFQFPIYKMLEYSDLKSSYYLVLSENRDTITPNGDTLNSQIKAICFQEHAGKIQKYWEFRDFIQRDQSSETSIWFWGKYLHLEDWDGDGEVEPLVVYGTAADNGVEDGRVKLLLFVKGQKYAIRHQNAILDEGRTTEVDKALYSLPAKMGAQLQSVMQKLAEDKWVIWPDAWQGAMKAKKSRIVNQ